MIIYLSLPVLLPVALCLYDFLGSWYVALHIYIPPQLSVSLFVCLIDSLLFTADLNITVRCSYRGIYNNYKVFDNWKLLPIQIPEARLI